MIKLCLIPLLSLFLSGCGPEPKTTDFSDDYVLIEFAARLEEDYQKLYPQPLEKAPPSPTE